jgi:hypothetical protein
MRRKKGLIAGPFRGSTSRSNPVPKHILGGFFFVTTYSKSRKKNLDKINQTLTVEPFIAWSSKERQKILVLKKFLSLSFKLLSLDVRWSSGQCAQRTIAKAKQRS